MVNKKFEVYYPEPLDTISPKFKGNLNERDIELLEKGEIVKGFTMAEVMAAQIYYKPFFSPIFYCPYIPANIKKGN
jgi:hypothetical protein